MCGMVVFTWVSRYVTPDILYWDALSFAFSRIQVICWGSSPSIATGSSPKNGLIDVITKDHSMWLKCVFE